MQVSDGLSTPAAGQAAGQVAVDGAFAPELERAAGLVEAETLRTSSPRARGMTLEQMLAHLGGGVPAAAIASRPTTATPVSSSGVHAALGPIVRPLPGPVGSGYGPRVHPVHGDVRFHHGVDIAAPTGTPIQSFAQGTVSFAGWRNGYGNLVIVQHADGIETRYAHQDTIDVVAGQVVSAGQVLGTVGATGTATGPHLHFEVRRNGASLDPAAWLPG